MNGKKAKALKKAAELSTAGMPETKYYRERNQVRHDKKHQEVYVPGTQILASSTRKVYQDLKQEFKTKAKKGFKTKAG